MNCTVFSEVTELSRVTWSAVATDAALTRMTIALTKLNAARAPAARRSTDAKSR